MNCDQAFDCLTDSGRRHSPQLEEHLAHCERCRQMLDTLEPALDLFDDLIPEPDLSGRGGAPTIAPESVRVAEQAAARLLAAGPKPPHRRRGTIVRYAAAAMVGALLMGLMGTMNNAVAPVENLSPCVFQSRQINRQAYPTANAVVRHCTECHNKFLNPTDIGVEAQPISIEITPEDNAAADLIVRLLSVPDCKRIFVAQWFRTVRVDRRLCGSATAAHLIQRTA